MYGYGYSYPNNPQGSGLMGRYEAGVRSDGGSFAFPIDTGLASRLEGLGLLNASSLVNSCNAGKESVLYNLIPTPVQSLDRFAVTRSAVKWVLGRNGLLQEIPANTPAFEYNTDGTYKGLLVEPAATNLALHSRDLTQAAWTATNATTSRTATGADGTSNTGTIVTATAGNATILQAITSASSARVFSARVRRRTGTGTVEITQDNGLTWATITLTSSYQQFSTASQTLTNPTVGLRVVTSGDAIDVDFCQAETGAVSTSPVVTAGSTQTRTADSVTLTGASSLIGQSAGTIYVEMEGRLAGANRTLISVSDGTNNNRINLQVGGGNTTETRIVSGGVTQGAIDAGAPSASVRKWALRYSSSGATLYRDGASVGTPLGAITIPATSIVRLGVAPDGSSNFLNGWLRSAVLFTSDIGNTSAIALTA